MVPISVDDFRRAGASIDRLRRSDDLRRWAHATLRSFRPRGTLEAATILASPMARFLAADDPRGKLALATTISAAGIPVTIEGLSLFSPMYVDDLDVLVLEAAGWVPACVDCPARSSDPVARHVLRYWP